MRLMILFFMLVIFGCSSQKNYLNSLEQGPMNDLDRILSARDAGDVSLDATTPPDWAKALHTTVNSSDGNSDLQVSELSSRSGPKAESATAGKDKKTGKKAFRKNDSQPDLVEEPEPVVGVVQRPKKPSGKDAFRQHKVSRDLVGESSQETTEEVSEKVVEFDMSDADDVVSDEPKLVDIVVVLDDSLSMNKYRRKTLSSRMKGFLDHLDPLQWRVGFIQSNMTIHQNLIPLKFGNSEIENTKWISKNTRSYKEIFSDTISQKLQRHEAERPLASLTRFIYSKDGEGLRENATLAVVIITDNDENAIQHKLRATSMNVLRAIKREHGEYKKFYAYSVTILDEECRKKIRRHSFSAEANYAPIVTELVDRVGGMQFSLCLDNYNDIATSIVNDHLGVDEDIM